MKRINDHMTHRLLEASVCLDFKSFTDTCKAAGERGNKWSESARVILLRRSNGGNIASGTPMAQESGIPPGRSKIIKKHFILSFALRTELLLPECLSSQSFDKKD